MAINASRLFVEIDSDVSGALRGIDMVGYRMGTLGRQGFGLGAQLNRLGVTITGIGLAFVGAGLAASKFFLRGIDEAIAYNKQVALTLTQVDQMGVTMQQVGDIGRRVAAEIPAPFEKMQDSLYDIFSSMDVNTVQAEQLLKSFARGAVAGQTDVQTAGRATIAIMNALHLGTDQINRIMDVQFQTVRKGVLTYEEYASTIGRLLPAAQRGGQSIETLGGMIAFLTRNGLSAAMAATSASRAIESMVNPKVIARLKAMGVTVTDSKGAFLQMDDVVAQLGKKMQGLTDEKRVQLLQALFLGAGGTIQARRFWDVALKNYDDLTKRVNEMKGAAGQLDDAYDIMFKTPAMQIQLLRNNLALLREEIGREFLPLINQGVGVIMRIVQWFRNLNDHVRESIVRAALLSSAFAIVFGIFATLSGVIMGLVGSMSTLLGIGVTLATFLTGGLLASLLAIPAGIFAIIMNWDTLKKAWSETAWVQDLIDRFKGFGLTWDAIINRLKNTPQWQAIGGEFTKLKDLWRDVMNTLQHEGWEGFIAKFPEYFGRAKEIIGNIFTDVWEGIKFNWEPFKKALFGGWQEVAAEEPGTGGIPRMKWVEGIIPQAVEALKKVPWKKVLIAISDGIAGVIQDAADIGVRIMDAIGNAISGAPAGGIGRALGYFFGKVGPALISAIGQLMASVPWYEIGKQITVFLIQMALGMAVAFINLDWLWPLLKVIKDHFWEILLAAIGIALLPEKAAASIGGFLGKIPLVGTFLKWAFEALGKLGGKLLEWGGEIFKALFRGIGEAFPKLGAFFSGGFTAAFDGLKGTIKGLGDGAVLRFLEFFENIGKAIGEWATNKLVPGLKMIGEKLFGWLPDVVDWGRQLYAKFLGGLSKVLFGIVDWMETKLIPALGMIEEKLFGWIPRVIEWGKQFFARILEGFANVVQGIADWVTTKLTPGLGNISSRLFGWLGDVYRWGGELLGRVWEALMRPIQAIAQWIDFQLAPWLANVMSRFAEFLSAITNFGKALFSLVWEAFMAMLRASVGVWSDHVWPFISKIPGYIIEPFSRAGDWLIGAGRAIIEGLWNGAKALWSSFTGWLSQQIDKLPGWVKNILGIKSPSKVFMEIGGNITAGLALGVRRGITDVQKQMMELSRQLDVGTYTTSIAPSVDPSTIATLPGVPPVSPAAMSNTPVSNQPSVNIENLNVTSMKPEDVAGPISSEIGWQLMRYGRK